MIDARDPAWDQLAALVAAVSDAVRDPRDVRPEHRLIADLGLSSLMAVNLVMDLEREFNFIVKEEDFDHIETVADLERVIERKRTQTAL
jgi:acyl carrier protein